MSKIEYHQKLEKAVQKVSSSDQLNRFWLLKGGIANEMIALEVITKNSDLKKWVLRKPSPEALKENSDIVQEEFTLLELLRKTQVKAPEPVLLDETNTIFPAPYLILKYIDGEPEFKPKDKNSFARTLASLLAEIHKTDLSKVELTFLKKQDTLLGKKLAKRPKKLDSSLKEEAIRNCLESLWPLTCVNKPVLIHGDFWPGNVLWKEEKLQAIIDWEDASISDPLYELAITRLDCLWILGTEAMEEFTIAYKSLTKIDFSNLPYWDLFAALRPASKLDKWASDWPSLDRSDITEDTMREGHNWFVNQAFEKISRL